MLKATVISALATVLALPAVAQVYAPTHRYGSGATSRDYGAPAASAYGVDTAYASTVKCGKTGVLAGGGLDAVVGASGDKHQCDQTGAYWSFSHTVPYQADSATDPRAAEYASRGCRLAQAALDGQQARYVRVCPDAQGRYRVAG